MGKVVAVPLVVGLALTVEGCFVDAWFVGFFVGLIVVVGDF